MPLRDDYGDALMRLKGRGAWWSNGCAICKEPNPVWRCQDCFGNRMVCSACVMDIHRDEPLHFMEEWEGDYFRPRTCRDLGLRYQIGHPRGEECPFIHLATRPYEPQATGTDEKGFVVLHNNGIHTLDIDFCGCPGAPSDVDQLMNIGWYPATWKSPATVATLSLLRRFHKLNLQARLPAYDFYNTLVLLTNAAGLKKVPNRLPQFMAMIREYRHLEMCIHAGRLHAPDGITGTKPGELAVHCRACPQPGVNLPEGWENAPPEVAWIYRLLLSEDANFKMKGRDRSSRAKDPTLGPGWAYMVASDAYLKYLVDHFHQDEISHCVSFAALWSANNKRAKGLRASGVGSVSCSRHEIFRPLGTGDLQKGERYANMDYIFFSSLIGTLALIVVASYDIACQWGINFWRRASEMPTEMKLPSFTDVIFKVPKFHLPPHVKKCHAPYSFNYTKGVGRTDGEGVERNWSWLNWAARSISVMGPGAREDTIDDLCGFSNWKKTVDLGNSLLKKMVLAIPQAMVHSRAFHAFTDGLRDGHEEDLQKWEKLVRAWEVDKDQENPYEYAEVEAVTMADVLARIAEEEHASVVRSGAAALQVKPGSFLIAGIEIQENQEAVALEAKRKERTTIQATTLQRTRTLLLGKVSKLHDIQETYMPGLRAWLGRQTTPPLPPGNSTKPEGMAIYLPSSLPADIREQLCVPGLVEQEDRLREAQAGEALRDLRSGLRTRTFAHQFKRKNTSGQAMYTKTRALTDGIEDRVRSAASRYRAARSALVALRGDGDWQKDLQELRKEDIRGMNERTVTEADREAERRARLMAGYTGEVGEEENVDEYGEPVVATMLFNLETGEGHRELSWIWYTGRTGNFDVTAAGTLHDGNPIGLIQSHIKVEWMKARARADRWREEVILLEEEMRRVITFCTWKAAWWDERQVPVRDSDRTPISAPLAEGLRAYALAQASRERKWASSWSAKWGAVDLDDEEDEDDTFDDFDEEDDL
ncbi:hypothetical protein C8R43DRAFT_1084402 [Mycena crocata]|nr:hypothetical protein C8R43DRAFT_1084402 [Mycena crocata]